MFIVYHKGLSPSVDVCSLKEVRLYQDCAGTIDFLSLNPRDLSFLIHLFSAQCS